MNSKINQALSIVTGSSVVSLILVADYNDCRNYRKVKLGAKLAETFREEAAEYLIKLSKKIDKGIFTLMEHDDGYRTENHEVEYVQVSKPEHATIQQLIDEIPKTLDLDEFDSNDSVFTSNLFFYIISIQNNTGEQVRLFRIYSAKKELTRSKAIAMIYRDGTYDKFEDKLFLFDDKVDCFLFDGILFVDVPYHFQLIFNYFEQVKKNADSIMTTVTSSVPIANCTELQECCVGHMQMLAKLNNIARKPYFKEITMDHIKKTIEAYKLNVTIHNDNGVEKLVFDKKNRWELLKLLDDDYLGSVMTDLRYIVNSKKAI